ncbi:hypothetical protein FRAAL0515 [Frankia alni ACN14a]|uniref:Uncharacterized protein n=1 Tax=Frankia alni (strain DSM 45986 / CECT 9034 / ACN14a) TaxID=326424 RepID=Q0RTB1_FRAAA|nr:hypothetical protein FRAAL0515 [Frankia alni ACN14a]
MLSPAGRRASGRLGGRRCRHPVAVLAENGAPARAPGTPAPSITVGPPLDPPGIDVPDGSPATGTTPRSTRVAPSCSPATGR